MTMMRFYLICFIFVGILFNGVYAVSAKESEKKAMDKTQGTVRVQPGEEDQATTAHQEAIRLAQEARKRDPITRIQTQQKVMKRMETAEKIQKIVKSQESMPQDMSQSGETATKSWSQAKKPEGEETKAPSGFF